MEEKTLNAEQSMELISRMIRNTRARLECVSVRPFLVCGYTTVLVSLLNYYVRVSGMNPTWSLTWFLIPLLTWLVPYRKSAHTRSEIDRIVEKIWIVLSIAIVPAAVISIFRGFSYHAGFTVMIALLMAIGVAVTGFVVRSRIYTIAGFVGMGLSCLMPLYDWWLERLFTQSPKFHAALPHGEILIFGAIFLVMMVIPGHIVQYQNRRRSCSRS